MTSCVCGNIKLKLNELTIDSGPESSKHGEGPSVCGKVPAGRNESSDSTNRDDSVGLQSIQCTRKSIEFHFLIKEHAFEDYTVLQCIYCNTDVLYTKNNICYIPSHLKHQKSPIKNSAVYNIDIGATESNVNFVQHRPSGTSAIDQLVYDKKNMYIEFEKNNMNKRIHAFIEEQRNLFEKKEENAHNECALFLENIHQKLKNQFHSHMQSEMPQIVEIPELGPGRDMTTIFALDEENMNPVSEPHYISICRDDDQEDAIQKDSYLPSTMLSSSLPIKIITRLQPHAQELDTVPETDLLPVEPFEAPHLLSARTFQGDVFNTMRSQSLVNRFNKNKNFNE